MSDYVDITNTKVAVDELGELWLNFEECLVPETAIIFNTSYNLITLAVRESTLPLDITTLLIDETQDVPNLVNGVREIFLIFLCDVLVEMGIIIDKDHVDGDSLPYLNNILNVIYSTDGSDDVMGLLWVLENETYTNKDRLVEVIKRLYDLDDDEAYPDIIGDVSADVIKGLMMALGADRDEGDDKEYMNPEIVKRVRDNRPFIKGTFAEEHILNGGVVGLSYEALSNMFINDIAKIMAEQKKDYYKQILALLVISSMTNEQIESGYEAMIKDFANDLDELYMASILLEELDLE